MEIDTKNKKQQIDKKQKKLKKDMYQSKLVRSALRSKKTATNKFVPLIKIDNDKVFTEKEGIEVLRKITSGSLLVVAFEEAETELPFKMFECFELNNPRNETGIWISENFIEDDEFGYKLICLVGHANTSEDSIRIHMFNSILASVVLINVYPGYSGYSFLKALQGRISYSKVEKENSQLATELANIIILERGPVKDGPLVNEENRLKNIERQQNITGLQRTYRSANFFVFPQDQELKYNKRATEQLYKKIIALHLTTPKQSKKLQYGPVLAQYIPQIVKQYNAKYSINYTDCLARIEIDDGYEAYMEALQIYNEALRRKFNGNQPIEDLDYYLQECKNDAIQDYKNRTRDIEYLTELTNTINDKEVKIHKINDSMWHEKNIEILRRQSKNLLVYAQNPTDTSFDVRKQTERIKNVYNQRAGGRTKEQDLNGFLQKLNETLGDDNVDKNKRINDLERERRNLQERLKKLEKGGCCSGKCEIM